MEKITANQNLAPKSTSKKEKKEKEKEPVKVVYISNPMRFQTSAAGFRDLVQKVTGQDSDIDNMPVFCPTNTPAAAAAASQAAAPGAGSSAGQSDPYRCFRNSNDERLLEDWTSSMFQDPQPHGAFQRGDQV